MSAKSKASPATKSASKGKSKADAKSIYKKVSAKSDVSEPVAMKKPQKTAAVKHSEWLQDVSMEVPVSAGAEYLPGERELDFSVGMRQQEADDLVRSELRARALVHARGDVLVLVEASYVYIASQADLRSDLPQYLYLKLRGHLETFLAMAGHTPPLPASLEKVA